MVVFEGKIIKVISAGSVERTAISHVILDNGRHFILNDELLTMASKESSRHKTTAELATDTVFDVKLRGKKIVITIEE